MIDSLAFLKGDINDLLEAFKEEHLVYWIKIILTGTVLAASLVFTYKRLKRLFYHVALYN